MKLHISEISNMIAAAAFEGLAALPYSLFLDSADRAHPDARYSFIMAYPIETIEAKDGVVTITNIAQQTSYEADPFETVNDRLQAWDFASAAQTEASSDLPPFFGGAAGLFGYDLARQIEDLPARATENPYMPDMAVGIYDQVIAFDHQENKTWIFTHAENETDAERKRGFLLSQIKAPSPQPSPRKGEGAVTWKSNFTAEQYGARVERVVDLIRAGDVFQVNLSQRFEAQLPREFDAYAHYRELRAVNAAPFAAFMNLGNIKIASASPERFLKVENGNIETKPIKGTRPRLRNADADAAQIKDLQNSNKDRAENIMIVDLLRNDLSKVCEDHSVAAEKVCEVESFASVHHLVSTVTGVLKKDKTPMDLLRACFPGGSITGAPKIRAMEIIDELEPARRGAYCGAIGYIGVDGAMDTNILIRTLVYENDRVSFQVGGGITADSNPAEEYQETLDKAAAIFGSFELQVASYKRKKSL